jgi:adenine-specific DNA-methyltransferase
MYRVVLVLCSSDIHEVRPIVWRDQKRFVKLVHIASVPLGEPLLEEAVCNASKRALGIYYTPSNAAKILTEWAIRGASEKVLEPSFGGCVFLAAARNRLLNLGCSNPIENLFGYDIDPTAFKHACEIFERDKLLSGFIKKDFIHANAAELPCPVDVIVGNPPFVAYRAMSPSQRASVEKWRQASDLVFSKNANLWVYFVFHALKFLRVGGRVAWVLPSTILTADYAEPLRAEIVSRFRVSKILRLQERLFLDQGTTEQAVLLCADGYMQPETATEIRVIDVSGVEALADELSEQRFNVGIPEDTENLSFRLQREFSDLLAKKSDDTPIKLLNDLLDVKIGDVVGDVRFFIQSFDTWRSLGIRMSELAPMLTEIRLDNGVLLSEMDVEPNAVAGRCKYVLYIRNKRVSAAARRYLSSYDVGSRDKNVTFRKRDCWFKVPYDQMATAFMSSISHDGPRLLLNKAKVAGTNALYRLKVRNPATNCQLIALGMLTSVTQLSAELVGRPLGGGALKLEPSDAKRLLLPTPRDFDRKDLSRTLIAADSLLREGRADEARSLADAWFIEQGAFLTSTDVVRIAEWLRLMREQRQPTQRRRIA